MNYRHIYHAGNFADVFKHCILISVIYSFLQKNKPFCYLDTHAGTGCYNLENIVTKKTPEYKNGIASILDIPCDDFIINIYKNIIALCNTSQNIFMEKVDFNYLNNTYDLQNHTNFSSADLKKYPGSPLIATVLSQLQTNNNLIFTELHPADFAQLKQNFAYIHNANIQHICGYQAMKAFLPFKNLQNQTMRGIVFIDPPFENNNEFERIYQSLSMALKRYAIGTYVIWYPNKNNIQVNKFKNDLQSLVKNPVLFYEFNCSKIFDLENPNALTQCEIAIINPPWQIENYIEPCLRWLEKYINT